MRLHRRAAFWLPLLSIVICLNHYFGNDDKNILLIGLNPVLNAAADMEPFRHWMLDFDSGNSAVTGVRYTAYLLHFTTYLLIGIAVDGLFYFSRRKSKP
ncbi:hypothetical protein [Paenibacillus tepidiphilus]|uniref:hypothetical protein n=1 Tax=Paenibacillus tepidiphilus TaxID=2608683 RepID=UPI00123C3089|nr:hypothetical protein [Paenibacillus tepidiphilus]